jgi:hypothetical protein
VIIAILLFILAIKRGFTIKNGNKSFGINNFVDTKIAQSRQTELHDRDLQNSLYNQALAIDSRGAADMKRVIRGLDDKITSIFSKYSKCSFPSQEIYQFISDELFQRIEDNNLRKKFSTAEKSGYISDIEYKIKCKYETFLLRIDNLTCGESYPKWNTVCNDVHSIVEQWVEAEITILVDVIRSKLAMYDENKNQFSTAEYKDSAITIPVQKNMTYLVNLGFKR